MGKSLETKGLSLYRVNESIIGKILISLPFDHFSVSTNLYLLNCLFSIICKSDDKEIKNILIDLLKKFSIGEILKNPTIVVKASQLIKIIELGEKTVSLILEEIPVPRMIDSLNRLS